MPETSMKKVGSTSEKEGAARSGSARSFVRSVSGADEHGRDHKQAIPELQPHVLAALPMYDLPHLQSANDQLWHVLAHRLQLLGLSDVPAALTREAQLPSLWTDPRLLLTQTCGYPLMQSLSGLVKVVATPKYSALGCRSTYHRSFIIVAAADDSTDLSKLRGRRCAVNGLDSNSGMNVLRALVAPLANGAPFFSAVIVSGSHHNSLRLVASGQADVASIDCVTFAHLHSSEPDLVRAVRLLAWSDETPCLPLITAASTDTATVHILQEALRWAETAPSLEVVRKELFLDGFDFFSEHTYTEIVAMESFAVAAGYPNLA